MHHKYKIIRALGSGAFSDVVLAEEEMTGRKVAIKGIKEKRLPTQSDEIPVDRISNDVKNFRTSE